MHNSVVVGVIGTLYTIHVYLLLLPRGFSGLADSFSYAFLGIINAYIMSRDEDPKMFLWFFISLSVCSFLAIIVTSMVSSEIKNENNHEKTTNANVGKTEDNFGFNGSMQMKTEF